MPIFEYKCSECGRVFETLVLSGQGENSVSCPGCKGQNLKKLISAPFLPSSVGKPANDYLAAPCCGSSPGDKQCTPGSCCGKDVN